MRVGNLVKQIRQERERGGGGGRKRERREGERQGVDGEDLERLSV